MKTWLKRQIGRLARFVVSEMVDELAKTRGEHEKYGR